MSVKIHTAALDLAGNNEIILRGVIDPASLHLIQVDDYQREVLPLATLQGLISAYEKADPVPDITLGMRGGNYLERDNAFYLQDPVFVIDGLQRISAAMHVQRVGKAICPPHIGCVVRFNTDRVFEKSLFQTLNTAGVKLSPNVLIRNLSDQNEYVAMLKNLCADKSFPLADRVSWQQRMKRNELLTALMLLKTCGCLHSSFGPGSSSRFVEAAEGGLKAMKLVGRTTMRNNLLTFYEVVDGAWGIRSVAFRESACYRGNFLLSLSQLIAHHKTFWDDNYKLAVVPDLRRKLSLFPVNDPNIQSLSSSGSTAKSLLYDLMLRHLNSGRRTRRLVPFKQADTYTPVELQEDDGDAA